MQRMRHGGEQRNGFIADVRRARELQAGRERAAQVQHRATVGEARVVHLQRDVAAQPRRPGGRCTQAFGQGARAATLIERTLAHIHARRVHGEGGHVGTHAGRQLGTALGSRGRLRAQRGHHPLHQWAGFQLLQCGRGQCATAAAADPGQSFGLVHLHQRRITLFGQGKQLQAGVSQCFRALVGRQLVAPSHGGQRRIDAARAVGRMVESERGSALGSCVHRVSPWGWQTLKSASNGS